MNFTFNNLNHKFYFIQIVKIAKILKKMKKNPNLSILVPLRNHMKRHAKKYQLMLDSENIKICYVGNKLVTRMLVVFVE